MNIYFFNQEKLDFYLFKMASLYGNTVLQALFGSEVEKVQCFKFLGLHLSSDLKWGCNADIVVKKGQQRLLFLRQLRSFHVSQAHLLKFYRAMIGAKFRPKIQGVIYSNVFPSDILSNKLTHKWLISVTLNQFFDWNR